MQSKNHSDYKYIQALLDNNRTGIKAIYQRFMKECINFVQKNSGTVDDALDIFQESLIAVTLYVHKRPEFILTVPFGGFLYPFYRRLWFKELKRRQEGDGSGSVIKSDLDTYKDNNQNHFNPTIDEEVSQNQKRLDKLLQQLKGLSEICQKILKLTFWENLKPREIAPLLGISSNFVAVRKMRCLKQLKKRM